MRFLPALVALVVAPCACDEAREVVAKSASTALACPEARTVVLLEKSEHATPPEDIAEDRAALRAWERTHRPRREYVARGCGHMSRYACTLEERTDESATRWTEWRCVGRPLANDRHVARRLESAARRTPGLELAVTVEHGRDPIEGQEFSKGCAVVRCGPRPPLTFPIYGLGLGARAGVSLDLRARPLTLRPYLGARYEHYFAGAYNSVADPANQLMAEAGFGLELHRLELRPFAGIGFVSLGQLTGPLLLFDVGVALSVRVAAGLRFGVFLRADLGPSAEIDGRNDSWIEGQSIDKPVVGLELGYRFFAGPE